MVMSRTFWPGVGRRLACARPGQMNTTASTAATTSTAHAATAARCHQGWAARRAGSLVPRGLSRRAAMAWPIYSTN